MPFPPKIVINATGLAPELNLKIGDYTGPSSYTTGGVTVSASVFGLSSGLYHISLMGNTRSGTYFARITSISAARAPSVLVKWFVAATGLEVNNGTNLSAEIFRFLALGV